MRNRYDEVRNLKVYFRVLILAVAVCSLAALTPRSTATGQLTISVVNNSQREIRSFYLSPADNDNWGPDQLSEAISPGTSRTLQVSWDESTVKLVAEDQDGCFLKKTIDATSNASWTITNDTVRNCGG